MFDILLYFVTVVVDFNRNFAILLFTGELFRRMALLGIGYYAWEFMLPQDNEVIVAAAMLCFFIGFIEALRVRSNLLLEARAEELIEAYRRLIKTKVRVLQRLRYYWRIFLDCEDNILYMFLWTVEHMKNIILKRNEARLLFIKYLIKDELVNLVREQHEFIYTFKKNLVTTTFLNVRRILRLQGTPKGLKIDDYLHSLQQALRNENSVHLVLTKLNLNKQIFLPKSKKFIDYNSYYLIKNSL